VCVVVVYSDLIGINGRGFRCKHQLSTQCYLYNKQFFKTYHSASSLHHDTSSDYVTAGDLYFLFFIFFYFNFHILFFFLLESCASVSNLILSNEYYFWYCSTYVIGRFCIKLSFYIFYLICELQFFIACFIFERSKRM
jgi:hypothetical protein